VNTHNQEEKLASALRTADVVVSYAPLPDEPDAKAVLAKHGFLGKVVHAPQDHKVSPHDFAVALHTIHEDKNVCILVPGRKFDMHGTRHGRGGGWYDRFLSAVPRQWLKIGLALPHHVSEEKLERKSWDQPMDYVLVCEK
jgi:5,10-methenyltetrahydrofolate synthetase